MNFSISIGTHGVGAFFCVFKGDSLFLHIKQLPHMKRTETVSSSEGYVAPSMRVIETRQEYSFLASDLEPIDGGGDPDIDW